MTTKRMNFKNIVFLSNTGLIKINMKNVSGYRCVPGIVIIRDIVIVNIIVTVIVIVIVKIIVICCTT